MDSHPWSLDEQFVKAVHATLKRVRRERELGRHPLAGLSLVEELRLQHDWPDTILGRAAALRQALAEARQSLAAADADAAALLEARFWQDQTVTRLARQYHVAETTIYARQKQALYALSEILWALDNKAQQDSADRQRHRSRNIPPPSYTHLFGLDASFGRLRTALGGTEGPWIVCLEGLGGLGKTALAHRLAVWAAGSPHFADVAWETAQQQQFTPWRGIVEGAAAGPALTFEALLDGIALQLGHSTLPRMPLAQKQAYLQDVLREQPYLIVVDNLETAADHDALVPQLWELTNPTRFLLTSRCSLGAHPHVLCLTLDELSEADSLALIRYEGAERGISGVADADDVALHQVYTVIGGNPLAIKLVVGQIHSLPFERVLCRLQGAIGKRYGDLYRFIYWQSWALLGDASRRVFLAMPTLAASGGYWENLLAVSGLPEEELEQAVQELVGLSLLNVGGVEERRYTIHRLTYTFIMSDLLEEWTV